MASERSALAIRRRRFNALTLLSLASFGCGARAGAAVESSAGAQVAARAIHIAGDSTAAEFPNDDPRVGWGAALDASLLQASDGSLPRVRVYDAARSGRSSKSFIDEGHWQALLHNVRAGDLILIQFGHNDQKPEPRRATDAATTFRDFLRRYVREARAAGAQPVLLSSICRRRFDGERLQQTHGAYPEATRAVAAETQTPLIDMTEKTRALLERFGPEASLRLFAPDDNTHLSPYGAQVVSRLVVDGLRDLGLVRARAKSEPALTAYPAAGGKRGHSAVLICPGGGYTHLSLEKEGSEAAAWLNQLGISAFVLRYRLADFGHPAPLEDVLGALTLLRSQAATWGFAPDRLGVLGFSAGGHLAACASCLYDKPSARPDFALLIYPVITLKPPHAHTGSRRALLGIEPAPALVEQLSLESRVTAATPPTFLMHTRDDLSVPVENSLLYQAALERAGVPNELLLYEHGPHGIGLRCAGADPASTDAACRWPQAAAAWLRARGLLD